MAKPQPQCAIFECGVPAAGGIYCREHMPWPDRQILDLTEKLRAAEAELATERASNTANMAELHRADATIGELKAELATERARLEQYRKFACDVQEHIDSGRIPAVRLAAIRLHLEALRSSQQPAPPPAEPAQPGQLTVAEVLEDLETLDGWAREDYARRTWVTFPADEQGVAACSLRRTLTDSNVFDGDIEHEARRKAAAWIRSQGRGK